MSDQNEMLANGFRKNEKGEIWFSESEVLWPGQKMSLRVKKMLFEGKSKYQHVVAFESTNYGKVLVLDGVIQLTERDEFAYQEMITHIPMFAHPNPESVLVVGGGDGGVLREVAKHPGVKRIVMCEIDEMVVKVSKELGLVTATAFDDDRLELLFQDAAEYVKKQIQQFDVIVVDSSDPVGPAETLFAKSFFKSLRESLRPGGIVCTQGECIWLHLDIISGVLKDCATLYPVVDYAYTTIPTYPSGQIGFMISSKGPKPANVCEPTRKPDPKMGLKYYTPDIHRSSFVLPAFAESKIAPFRKRQSN